MSDYFVVDIMVETGQCTGRSLQDVLCRFVTGDWFVVTIYHDFYELSLINMVYMMQ